MKKSNILKISVLVLLSFVTIVSCRKKKDTIAVITVRDSSNASVSGAKVVLYPQPTGTGGNVNEALYDTAFTNSNGQAQFEYNDVYQLGQAGVLVMNILVTSNSQTGQGVIKVEEEVTTEETVFLP